MNVVFSTRRIQQKIKELAERIQQDCKFNNIDTITILSVLSGGGYTAIDLSRSIDIPCQLEYIKVSSYKNSKESGEVELQYCSLDKQQKYEHILIVDDIFSTGKTLAFIKELLNTEYTVDKISTLTLVKQTGKEKVDISLDYYGFEYNDPEFLYGYGLDKAGFERNLTYIYK